MHKLSILIRTFNEEYFLPRCLDAIKSQDIDLECEIIVIDSESVDTTVQIALDYGCTVLKIKKSNFSYGRALNYGVQNANGDIIVSISAHCIPENSRWLINLVDPILKKVCKYTFGRHVAANDARISEIEYFKNKFPHSMSAFVHFNNGNSAFLKSIWCLNRFDETLVAQEDVYFERQLNNSYKEYSMYIPSATVTHVHKDKNVVLFRRLLKENYVEYKIGAKNLKFLIKNFVEIPAKIFTDILQAIKIRKYKAFMGILEFRFLQIAACTLAYLKISYEAIFKND